MPKRAKDALQNEHFTLSFSMKTSSVEVEHEGQVGVISEGYSTLYNVVDQEDEWTTPEAFATAARTFFDNSNNNGPLGILYHHGLDPVLSTKKIGRVIDYRIDSVGVWVKCFHPRPVDIFDDIGKRALQVYEQIKAGIVSAYSIGGILGKIGRAIKSAGLYEISATPIPCLAQATFSLARKSLGTDNLPAISEAQSLGSGTTAYSQRIAPGSDFDPRAFIETLRTVLDTKSVVTYPSEGYGDDDPDDDAGPDIHFGLTRKAHDKALGVACKDGSTRLHDHLLNPENYPVEAQGEHSADACPICAYRRDLMGIKAALSTTPWKKIDKSTLPRSAFLDQGDPDKKSTWRYPVYEGRGAKDDQGCYTERGPLNKNGVLAAEQRARQQGDSAILDKIKPLLDAAGFEPKKPGKKARALSPKKLPSRMLEHTTAALQIAYLLENLPPAEGGDSVEIAVRGKAGRALSATAESTLRSLAHDLIDSGQSLLTWVDKTLAKPDKASDGDDSGDGDGDDSSSDSQDKDDSDNG